MDLCHPGGGGNAGLSRIAQAGWSPPGSAATAHVRPRGTRPVVATSSSSACIVMLSPGC